MKNLKFLTAILAATFLFSSCLLFDDDPFRCERGQGPTVTRVLDLPSFSGIDLQISGDVVLRQGNEQYVEVEGQDNIIDLLRLSVSNNTWKIKFTDCVRNYDNLMIYITLPDIDEIKISGSGDVYGDNLFEGNNLDLNISGSGDMDLGLDYKNVDTRITGSGDIRLEGDCRNFDLDITGSGDYHAFDMKSENGKIRISGSGKAEVWVTDDLEVRIPGSGDVYYIGYPDLDIDITGSGKVIDVN